MINGQTDVTNRGKNMDELEPYRQLIKVQKELAWLAKQHEQTKRECTALREQLAREVIPKLRHKSKWRYRLERLIMKRFRRLPPAVPTDIFHTFSKNQPSSC